jgi:SulP family sulfate permease
LITAAVVIFVGVEQGILLAIILSLVVHTRHGYKPENAVLAERDGRLWVVPVSQAAQAAPGLILYRFNHSMYYANAELLATQIQDLLRTGPDPVSWLCIDMIAVDDVDFTAAVSLHRASSNLKAQGVRLVFADVNDHVRRELDRSGITDLVGPDAYYESYDQVLDAYRKSEATDR